MQTSTPATVAVIDDDASVRKALRRLLRAAGMQVQTFATAEDFLGAAERPPDCLVLDVRLPGLGGLELQRRLAAEGRHVPIVFITGHQDEQARREALAAGAVDFLLKPFEDESLLQAVTRAAARHEGPPGG
jgi:FixJ family two-component response regulator